MAKTLLGGEATIDGNPSARVSVSADEQGGITDIRIKPHVDVSRDAATGALSIAAMFDPRDLGFAEAKIRNALRDFGCSAEEIADVLPRAMSSMTPVSHETPPLLQYQKTLRIGDHERGLLKIAYELAWYWLGDQYLMDAKAFLLRDVLLGKRPLQDVEGTINGESVKSLALWDEEDRRHVAFLLNTGGRYFLHLRLFDVFQLTIVLSDDPLVYRHPDRDVLLFCPTARTFTESTLVKEIAAFVQRANQ